MSLSELQREKDTQAADAVASDPPADRALEAGAAAEETAAAYEGRFELRGRGLRKHTARGVIINSAFQVGLAGLMLFRRVAVAVFLTTTAYGLWGLLVASFMTLVWLKQIGINDKYIQQNDADQELAFQRAFSLELVYSLMIFVVVLATLPLYAFVIYGRPEIIVPGAILALGLIASAFQAPIWVAYRQLQFVRQRVLQSVDPVVTTILTIGLAIAGAGLWALVIGSVVGSFIGAGVAVASSPYPLALRVDRATVRSYFHFSWPLLIASASSLVVVQGSIIVGNYSVGLAGIAAIGLAGSFSAVVDRIDTMIRLTIYPSICAVSDELGKLREAFEKSNRLALIWGMPFGIMLALFAGDLVSFVLGERWRDAVPLMQAFGLIIAFRQIGFSWTMFMRAVDRTKPIAASGVISVASFLVITAPLLLAFGLNGYIVGMAIATAIDLVVRAIYLRQLFPGFSLLAHASRAVAPALPPTALLLISRLLLEGSERSPEIATVELVAFTVMAMTSYGLVERSLLREIIGYLRRPARRPQPAAS